MGMLAEAIRARRQQRQRWDGGQLSEQERESEVLVGTIGFVAGADHCIAFNEADLVEIEQRDVPIRGIRFTALTADRLRMARSRGASYASCTLDEVQANVALDPGLDIVVRVLDAEIDEASARGVGPLQASRNRACAAVSAQFAGCRQPAPARNADRCAVGDSLSNRRVCQ